MLPPKVLFRAGALLSLFASARVGAQCSDGSSAVNGVCRSAVASRPVPIDANRVAVLPFRVTTADSLLGEGFAELLAQEFTGEGGPRAVDMSTVLSNWRRAGAGLRSPLALDSAMVLARRLGAGILLQGQIAGLGGRLSISASMIHSSTAMPIGGTARVSGPSDSVESLLRQTAAALLGGVASERILKTARLSKNPEALRAYLEGMALARRGLIALAAKSFERSAASDTLFASAAYQRWMLGTAYAGGGLIQGGSGVNWTQRTRSLVGLLTDRERSVFLAVAGPGVGPGRTRKEIYTERRRTAERLGDSPDAWFFAGDYTYHNGLMVVGADSVIPLARQFFSIAAALDTQPVFLFHLTDIAVNTHDTVLMRRLIPAYSRVENEERWIRLWVFATNLVDQRLLDSLNRVGPPGNWGRTTELAFGESVGSRTRAPQYEDLMPRLLASHPGSTDLAWLMSVAEIARGRRPETVVNRAVNTFSAITGDLATDSVLFAALQARPASDSVVGLQCYGLRLAIERGESPTLDSTTVRNTRCRWALEAIGAFKKGALSEGALARFDSLVASGLYTTFMGFEHRALAHIYEARGDTAMALRAIRMYPRDYLGAWYPPTLREEGRLFLLTRDTARAISSYEEYLARRVDAQPPYVAERDSIRALVSRLKLRVVP